MRNANTVWCLVSIFSLVVRQGTGCHPRHPPRAFPLGLLAPRCLGSLRFLASIACGLSGSGRHLFGGRKESSPQLRSHPRIALLVFIVVSIGIGLPELVPRIDGPSDSALAQPPFSFSK